jgi:hypothetical protein
MTRGDAAHLEGEGGRLWIQNRLLFGPAASQQSDSAVIGPTGQARLGLADDPRR